MKSGVAAESDHPREPGAQEVIFRSIEIARDHDDLSRYGDEIWNLGPLANKSTLESLKVHFKGVPEIYRATAKRIVWTFINERTPLEELTRKTATRTRITAGSIADLFYDIRRFLIWLEERSIFELFRAGDADFRAYADSITSENLDRERKQRLLFSITRVWLIAPYLPACDQLPRPVWEYEGEETHTFDALLGPRKPEGQNKTPPVHPQSMSALLLASLRFVEVFASDIIKAVAAANRGDEVAEAPLVSEIEGSVDGERWCSGIAASDVGVLQFHLVTACFIVTAYLSGMRFEECRSLERGCCTSVEAGADAPPHFQISGRIFKAVVDEDGNTVPGGQERERPWLVVELVSKAIGVAEMLHSAQFVFADSCFRDDGSDGPAKGHVIRPRIVQFIAWWNTYCASKNRMHEVIPPDPLGAITPRRLRQTLAWFIYRLPGGRIALGLQYGHLRGYTSDGYGSRIADGMRDIFPMEEALSISNTLQSAARKLDDGEQVSGPAADRFLNGVRVYQAMFEGTFLSRRQMSDLRRNPALRIFDNSSRALACVYDQSKALCHPERGRESSDSNRTPDVTRCRDNCPNGARTDTHAAMLKDEIERLRSEIESELTPEPIRERLIARIERREKELEYHEANRRTG